MISDIHEKITEEFNKRKLTPFTVQLDLKDMVCWSESVAKKHGLVEEDFEKYIKEMFWGLVSIQLSLGYSLISINDAEHPSGKKGIVIDELDIPTMDLSDIHFWHHLHNTWEAIYRFWERAVSVLEVRLTPKLTKPLYFTGYLNLLKSLDTTPESKEVAELMKYNKAWGNISSNRNRISHEVSNPCSFFELDVELSPIQSGFGKPIEKIMFELPNLKQEIDTVINYYKKSHELLYAVKSICDSSIKPNK